MMSIDGVHLERDLGLHLLADSEETMIPQVRQDSVEIPGRHGEIVFDSYLESRRLFPTVLIPSQATLTDVQNILRKVSSLLLDRYGRPKDVKVIYDYEPEKYYICRLNGYLSPERVARTGKFLIPLYANDPFAYAPMAAYDPKTKQNYNSEIQYDAGNKYPNTAEFNWIYKKHYSGLSNYSYYATDLILTIQGTVASPTITHLETGTKIKLPTINNGSIEVDSSNFTIKVNGMVDLTNTNAAFIELVEGSNSLLFESSSPNAKVTFNWKHKFI